jgi:hypothetical protein
MAPQKPSNSTNSNYGKTKAKRKSQMNRFQNQRFLEQLEKLVATQYSLTEEDPNTPELGHSKTNENPKPDNLIHVILL